MSDANDDISSQGVSEVSGIVHCPLIFFEYRAYATSCAAILLHCYDDYHTRSLAGAVCFIFSFSLCLFVSRQRHA